MIILDINNVSGNSDYDYLEGTITKAIRKELQKNAAFVELEKEKWQKIAEKNYIFKKDMHTKTAAVNLGLLTNQDVVLAGFFNINNSARGNSELSGYILLYSISKKELVVSIPLNVPISGEMFDAIDKAAIESAEALNKVLPNLDDWKRSGMAAFARPKQNHINLGSGALINLFSSNSFESLEQGSGLSPVVFTLSFKFQLEYLRHQVFFPWLVAGVSGHYYTGSTSVPVKVASGTIPVSLQSFGGELMAAYKYLISDRLYILGGVASGYQMSNYRLDFSSDSLTVLDSTTNRQLQSETVTVNEVIFSPFARVVYRITQNIDTGLDLRQTNFLYNRENTGGIQILFLVGYGF